MKPTPNSALEDSRNFGGERRPKRIKGVTSLAEGDLSVKKQQERGVLVRKGSKGDKRNNELVAEAGGSATF